MVDPETAKPMDANRLFVLLESDPVRITSAFPEAGIVTVTAGPVEARSA